MFNPSINIVHFKISNNEAKELLKSKFKLNKFPAIHLISQNKEYDVKNAYQVKFDIEEEDLIDEINLLAKGNIVDIAEKTLTQRMVSNANEGKITYCFLYEGST